MKRVLGWIVAVAVIVSGFVASAQTPPQATPNASVASAETAPTLSDVEKLTLTNKIQAAQLAGQGATTKALTDAIAQLIEQHEQRRLAAQQALNDANAYYNGLAKDGYTLNAQTMTYEKAQPKK